MTEPEVVESLLPPDSAKPTRQHPRTPPPWPLVVGATLLAISAGRILLAAVFPSSPIIGPLGWLELGHCAVVVSFLLVLVRRRWAWLGLLAAAMLEAGLTG